jgi:hypothetical protein
MAPVKLTEAQRAILMDASHCLEKTGESIPYCDTNLPYGWRASLNGLARRGLLERRKGCFFYITAAGRAALAAIQSSQPTE